MIYIRKFFYLRNNYSLEKGKNTIDDLNNLLECMGISFSVSDQDSAKKLYIEVNEEKLKAVTDTKVGRPVEHTIDFAKVEQMKANGMTNKQVYTELGISKSLFYLKMKEYKNNIGHKKER